MHRLFTDMIKFLIDSFLNSDLIEGKGSSSS